MYYHKIEIEEITPYLGNLSDTEIARKYAVSRERIRQIRKKIGIGKYCYVKPIKLSRKPNKIIRICKTCKKEFTLSPSTAKNSKGLYCSRKCYWDSSQQKLVKRN